MFQIGKVWHRFWNSRSSPAPHPALAKRYGLLFDLEQYRRQFPKVGATAEQAIRHFLKEGIKAGVSPTPLFLVEHYLQQAGTDAAADPLDHFRQVGWRLGLDPHPLFHTASYVAKFGDAIESHGDPLSHYLAVGWKSGWAPHPLVNSEYSASRLPRESRSNSDPVSQVLRGAPSGNKRPHPCFAPKVLQSRLAQLGSPTGPTPLLQLFANWDSPLSPTPLFDCQFYAKAYPESVAHPRGPWGHFVESGQFGDYDPNPYFDSAFYRRRYGSSLGRLAPFMHYMTHEASKQFDPSAEFQAKHYDRAQPQVLKNGGSLLEHFLTSGRYTPVATSASAVPEWLKRQLLDATKIEPAINVQPRQLSELLVYNRHCSNRISLLFRTLQQAIDQPFSVLVLVPFLSRGGADLEAIHLVRWLQQQFSTNEVLLVLTDTDMTKSLDWLPEGTRTIVFSHLAADVKPPERERLVQLLIEEYRPRICHNVNSRAAWQLFAEKGNGLSKLTSLRATIFCFDYDPQMRPVGYAIEHLPRAIEHLDSVNIDNDAFRRTITATLGLTPRNQNKFHTLYSPAKDFGGPVGVEDRWKRLFDPSSVRKVMWAGRLDRQKRPDLLLSIAKQLPEFEFHVFGGVVLGNQQKDPLKDAPENIKRYGEYREFFELPLAEMDAFLYTAAWDGIPNILIDSMQAGLPTVAPEVGGIAELVDEETGWLIADGDDPLAYVKSLRQLFMTPDLARRRVEAAWERLTKQHSWSRFNREVARISGLAIDTPSAEAVSP